MSNQNGLMFFGAWSLEHDGMCWHLTETRATTHHRAKSDTATTVSYHPTVQAAFRHAAQAEMALGAPATGLNACAKALAERLDRLETCAKWFAEKHGMDHLGKQLATGDVVKRTRAVTTKPTTSVPAKRERIVRKVS